jgi:hypothetical protein
LWENSLATSLCTWSLNELSHLLSVIKTIFGTVAGEQATNAISTGVRHSLSPQDFFWNLAISSISMLDEYVEIMDDYNEY